MGSALIFNTGIVAKDQIPNSVHQFMDMNCFECHNEVDKEGGLDLVNAKFNSSDLASMNQWILMLDRVMNYEMPPKEDVLLEEEERAEFLVELEKVLFAASVRQQKQIGRVRSRRLNREEYEKSLQGLVGVDIPLRKLIPKDPVQDGFSNVADAQQISYHLLQKYLEAADAALDEAFTRAMTTIVPIYKNLAAADFAYQPDKRIGNNRGPWHWNDSGIVFSSTQTYHGRMHATKVPESGWYRIHVKAHAVTPPEGRGVWTSVRSGVCYANAPTMFWIGSFEAQNESKEHTFEAWIEKEHMLEIRPMDHTLLRTSARSHSIEAIQDPKVAKVALERIEIERIYKGPNPTELQQLLFGRMKIEDGQLVSKNPKRDVERLMRTFATRAFRKPVGKSELRPYLEVAFEVIEEKLPVVEAIRAGYRAVLCSPRFLYFNEPVGKLDDYSIASRLSYFFWGTFPDDELLNLARRKRLSRSSTLSSQIDRMLNDPKSESFIRRFSDQWLDLKEIDFTTPDQKLYPEFDEVLKNAMMGETHAFLREMINEDLSVTNVVDSDFTMLNERIAHHYGIKGVRGTEFQKVALKPEYRRGGLITHGSVLKVTANGTTTSPVIRGVYMLERIMGEKTLPPPDDIPAIEPDIRGAQSIRDQLDKHRNIQSCAVCHVKIDPPGFALENYNVIGGWRENYRAVKERGKWWDGPSVDPSFVTPDGQAFADIDEFKQILLNNPEKIAHNLIEKCIIFSTGASIEFADRRDMEVILEKIKSSNYGFRSLIHAVVQSPVFLNK